MWSTTRIDCLYEKAVYWIGLLNASVGEQIIYNSASEE